ncbi:hypothetical protein BCR36DRAFT_368079 [Piromyces finnis]|uniref:AAA-ATPase-like domain-containing protein n=1 Tax=Piromyces finnis TaxID=1754191 RepID=A0A1Y1VH34_9FUNG|nr:hypothetical protein BCR36DRAFT_368079 [Piromyces finnis]|eukprot:ORX55332.1 hypothetical protein BCR36DRAFT_368079 [Piromyces finnis]
MPHEEHFYLKNLEKHSLLICLQHITVIQNKKQLFFNDKNISKRYINQAKTRAENKPEENNLKYLNEYNVIKLDMNKYFSRNNNFNVEVGIKKIKRAIVNSVKMKIKNFSFNDEFDIIEIINDIFIDNSQKIIFLIDEWDFLLRNKVDENSIKIYLEFLNDLFIEKSSIALVCMTGILPIKEFKDKRFDMFTDYSMIYPSWTAKYFEFTKREVEILCNKLLKNEKEKNYSLQNSMKKEQKLNDNLESEILKEDENFEIEEEVELFHKKKSILKSIEHWYKGYQLLDLHTQTLYELYTPYSIINTIKTNSIK